MAVLRRRHGQPRPQHDARGSRRTSRRRTSAAWCRASARRSRSMPMAARSSTAHVQSIGAGTGSEFSLLPAQNANGNWVKVTQRVPVRIAFNGTPSTADDRRACRSPPPSISTTTARSSRAHGRRNSGPSRNPSAADGRAADRHRRGDDGRAAAGARHDHRQRRAAAHAGRPQCDAGPDQLGADELHRRLGDRASDQRLACRPRRAASGCC